MNGGHLPTKINQIITMHDINWGVLNHASQAPQLMSCNYCVCVCVSIHTCIGIQEAHG